MDEYFNFLKLGTAPILNVVLVDNAEQNYQDTSTNTYENYIDIEIVAPIVPKANITLYFTVNSVLGLYDGMTQALLNNHVVTVSWGLPERDASSYWDMFQALLLKYYKVPCFISTGDAGSLWSGQKDVGFPESCPNAISIKVFFHIKTTSLTTMNENIRIKNFISYVRRFRY